MAGRLTGAILQNHGEHIRLPGTERVQVVARGALAHAAKVREGLDCLPTMNRGRVYTQLLSESPSLGLCFVLFMLEYIGRRGRWRCIETAEDDGFEGRDKVRRLSVR